VEKAWTTWKLYKDVILVDSGDISTSEYRRHAFTLSTALL